MAILWNKESKVFVFGSQSKPNLLYMENMIGEGTNIVAGVSPGFGGDWVLNEKIPIFDGVSSAIEATGADTAVIFELPSSAKDALMECIEGDVSLIVCVTEDIPIHDMILVKQYLRGRKTKLLGPNTAGLYSPGNYILGVTPPNTAISGKIGVLSRSSTLAYYCMHLMAENGVGVSSFAAVGDNPVVGWEFQDVLEEFERDPFTEAVILLGELGGEMEENAAKYISQHFTKQVVAYQAGQSLTADVLVNQFNICDLENTQEKNKQFHSAGMMVAEIPQDILRFVKDL